MSIEGQALMRAVLANPDDDAPRWVIADWFQEHGHDELAEFVRWQLANPDRCWIREPQVTVVRGGLVEVAGIKYELQGEAGFVDARRPWFRRFTTELTRAHPDWAWVWRRGFVEQIGLHDVATSEWRDRGGRAHTEATDVPQHGPTSTQWLTDCDRLLMTHPIRKVCLTSRLGVHRKRLGVVLRGAEENVVAPWGSNPRGLLERTCRHANLCRDGDKDDVVLSSALAMEWRGIEFVMPPELARPRGRRLPDGFRASTAFSRRPHVEVWETDEGDPP